MEVKLSKRSTLVKYIVDKVENDGQRASWSSVLQRSYSLFFQGEKKMFPCGSTENWVECYLFVYSASVVCVLHADAWGCNMQHTCVNHSLFHIGLLFACFFVCFETGFLISLQLAKQAGQARKPQGSSCPCSYPPMTLLQKIYYYAVMFFLTWLLELRSSCLLNKHFTD